MDAILAVRALELGLRKTYMEIDNIISEPSAICNILPAATLSPSSSPILLEKPLPKKSKKRI